MTTFAEVCELALQQEMYFLIIPTPDDVSIKIFWSWDSEDPQDELWADTPDAALEAVAAWLQAREAAPTGDDAA